MEYNEVHSLISKPNYSGQQQLFAGADIQHWEGVNEFN